MRERAAALLEHEGFRYTVAIIANGAVPTTVEAEIWYYPPGVEARGDGWKYFGRWTAAEAAAARELVVHGFKAWVEEQREADAEGTAP